MLAIFTLWTAALRFVDVQAIGPQGSVVGFAAMNRWFHSLTGVHMALYTATDWLGLIPMIFAAGFALLGLVQWIRRKRLTKVDRTILLLGGFYVAVMAAYCFFERVVINYRPVLINGCLEASYPSTTTVLVMCVMPTAVMELKTRIQNDRLGRFVSFALTVFGALMVLGRLLSGVHWLSDIIGGALLSVGLVLLYAAVSGWKTT